MDNRVTTDLPLQNFLIFLYHCLVDYTLHLTMLKVYPERKEFALLESKVALNEEGDKHSCAWIFFSESISFPLKQHNYIF